jgi:hypothetical protein
MIKRRWQTTLASGLVLLVILAAASLVLAATARAHRATADGKDVGEVLLDDKVVIRFNVDAGDQSPAQRAEAVANRLNNALQNDAGWQQFTVQATNGGNGVYAGNKLIAMATRDDAQAAGTNTRDLAFDWRDNIITTLGGKVPSRGGQEGDYDSWEGAKQKWVPILDVTNNGIRVGAAQVAGPAEKVEQVKAVALLGLNFKGTARIKVYVPIDDLSVSNFNRVQGVSVWAIGDLKIVGF